MGIIWSILIIAGLLTYLIRLSFIALLGKWTPSDVVKRTLRFVPPAVLTAILLPELFFSNNHFMPANPRLLAGVVAAVIAWRTNNVILTIAVGMGVLIFIQAFL